MLSKTVLFILFRKCMKLTRFVIDFYWIENRNKSMSQIQFVWAKLSAKLFMTNLIIYHCPTFNGQWAAFEIKWESFRPCCGLKTTQNAANTTENLLPLSVQAKQRANWWQACLVVKRIFYANSSLSKSEYLSTLPEFIRFSVRVCMCVVFNAATTGYMLMTEFTFHNTIEYNTIQN